MARPVLAPLPDGRVLVMGAGSEGEDQTPSAELYDPATGTSVSVGALVPVRWVDSATPLKDGRVLIIGGEGQSQIFDPGTMQFSPVGAMVTGRSDTVAALLGDGRVLVVGGGRRDAELFDPDTLTFSRTGTMAATPVEDAAVATLPDGRVVVPAGVLANDEWAIEAEVYDPATGTFSAAGRMPDFGVTAAIGLPDGRALFVGSAGIGGKDGGRAAIWDPATRAFAAATDPWGNVSRATLLDDGRVLMLGFVQFPRDRTNCQVRTEHACSWAGIYDPATGATVVVAPPTGWGASVIRLTDGRVLVVGGSVSGEIGPAPAANGAPAVPTVQMYE
jgi:WD40 repeat protein